MLVWNEDIYAVGEPTIDSQHRQIVDMINALNQALDSGPEPDQVQSVIRSLIRYTETHFAYEEDLLTRVQHAALDGHRRIHEHLRKQARALESRTQEGDPDAPLALLHLLESWLLRHIKTEDQPLFGPLARARG